MQHPRATANTPRMKIAILDDYLDTTRTLACFDTLAGHDVTVFNDHLQALALLAERRAPFDALVLIRERTRIDASLIDRLPRLRLISLRSSCRHAAIGSSPPRSRRCGAGPGRRPSAAGCTAGRSGSTATGGSAASWPGTVERSG